MHCLLLLLGRSAIPCLIILAASTSSGLWITSPCLNCCLELDRPLPSVRPLFDALFDSLLLGRSATPCMILAASTSSGGTSIFGVTPFAAALRAMI
jgi:hypothetical protein